MRQNNMMRTLEQHALMRQAVLACAQRIDPTTDGRHPLADIEMQPLDTRGIDRPTRRCSDLCNGIQGAQYHPVCDGEMRRRRYDFTT
jgi:hypothetical protein